MDLTTLTAPVPSVAASAPTRSTLPPDFDQAADTATERDVTARDQAAKVQQHTVRYRVEGRQISVEILDGDGRVVRTVPAQDLIKLRQRHLPVPSLNIHG